jgi:hypothetical protein
MEKMQEKHMDRVRYYSFIERRGHPSCQVKEGKQKKKVGVSWKTLKLEVGRHYLSS